MKYMLKLWDLIKKDFKILMRSKSSALIIIFGPLLLILLLGFAFNTSGDYHIKIGVYSEAYSELTENILAQLKTNYDVGKIDIKDDCINQIKTGNVHVCLIFPKDMQVGNDNANEIEFYVDYSRINLAYAIMDSISTSLETKSSELSLDLTNKLVTALNNANAELSSKQDVMGAAVSNNNDAVTKANNAYNTISSLDTNYSTSSLNLTTLDNSLSAQEAVYNATFSDLREAINNFKTATSAVFSKLDNVNANKAVILTDLETLKTTLETDKENLESVKGGIDKVLSEISTIQVTNAQNIVSPFKTTIKPVVGEKTHLGNMFPSLMVLIIMFITLILASTLTIQERLNKAYFRNFISPTKAITYLLATFITNFLIVITQIIIILGVALYFFKDELLNVLLNTGIALLLIIAVFITLGMLLGFIFKSQETTILGALFVSSILLFFSNTLLPLESLPENIRKITLFNPFVVSQELLKSLMLFNLNIMDVLKYVIILLVFLGVFASLTFLMRELTRRRQY